MQKRTKILLTEGSSSSARQALYSLQEHVVDIVDPAALCQCRFSSRVRRWLRCPSYSQEPEAYLRFLASRISTGQYDILFPTHEQVYLLSYFREAFQKRVALAVPQFETLRRMQSKVEFARLLDELGLTSPRYQIVHDQAELESVTDFPCYLKLAHGTGGMGVKPVNDITELRQAYQEFSAAGLIAGDSEVLVQQPARGTPGVVQSVFQNGRLIAAHCSEPRLVGLGGGQMIRESVQHPPVWEDLRRLGDQLQWHGALFLDYFHDPETNREEYVEANPRIGETVSARLCGVNLCQLLVQISLGQPLQPVEPTRSKVCSHNGFQVLLAKAIQGASRRTLIAEFFRMVRGRGVYRGCENETTRIAEDFLSVIPGGAVLAQILVQPRSADRIVRSTIENYALPEAGVRRIEALSKDLAEKCFQAG